MNVQLLAIQPGKTDKAEIVEHAARVCYRSEMSGSKEKRRRFLLRLAERQHLSVFEHARYVGFYKDSRPYDMYWPMRYGVTITQREPRLFVVSMNARNGIEFMGKNPLFNPECLGLEFLQYDDLSDDEKVSHASATFEMSGISRSCSHQIVRHRLASYSQESMRYCRYGVIDPDLKMVLSPPALPSALKDKRHGLNKFAADQEEFVVQQYLAGFNCDVLAEAYGVDPTTIRSIVIRHGQKIRSMREAKNIGKSINYFADIDTPSKAYALGLVFSDGNIAFKNGKPVQCVICQHKDFEAWLSRVGRAWGGRIVSGGRANAVKLTVPGGSSSAVHLHRHGVVQAKSLVLEPPNLSKDLIPHFVRGYFDGDGYVAMKQPQLVIASGSRKFLEWIRVQTREITPTGSISGYHLSWAGVLCVPAVLDWLYQDFDFLFCHPKRLRGAIEWSDSLRREYYGQIEEWADKLGIVVPWSVMRNPIAMSLFVQSVEASFQAYANLLSLGIPKEDARYVLPIGTQTTIVMTCNFREWRHFIKLRASKHAQWEIRGIANAVLEILHNHAPVIFEDLVK